MKSNNRALEGGDPTCIFSLARSTPEVLTVPTGKKLVIASSPFIARHNTAIVSIRTSNHVPIVSSSICYSNLYNSSCTGTSSDEGSAAGVAVADVSTVSDVVEADSSGRSVASDVVAVEVAVFLGLALGIRLFPSRMT
jgi:hypothetical protein